MLSPRCRVNWHSGSPARAIEQADALRRRGDLVAAHGAYQAVLERDSASVPAWIGLGLVALAAGRPHAALPYIESARRLSPLDPVILNILGLANEAAGRDADAQAAWQLALEIAPGLPDVLVNLANADARAGRIDEAISRYRSALASDPRCASAAANLGGILVGRRTYGEAVGLLKAANAQGPPNADVLVNLGRAYSECGYSQDARASFEAALRIRPGDQVAISNLLMALHYCDDIGAEDIAIAHRAYGRSAERDGPALRPPVAPGRPSKFRIGLLSGDFNDHAVMRFLLPLLLAHDPARDEMHCYYTARREDAVTEIARNCVFAFLPVANLGDEALYDRLRDDGLDVLVDLAGHSAGGRPRVLARRPAPLQVSWLGYLNTTGLSSIDFRITDAAVDPPGLTDHLHTERLWRLDAMWCYLPRTDSPPVAVAPALRDGIVTFASTNNPAKISTTTLSLWGDVLKSVPHSRLVVHAHDDPLCRDRISTALSSQGIDAKRLSFMGRQSAREYLSQHGQFDILLDTTPYSGGTTACDALWMGIPVVTLAGVRPFSRTCASILQAAGFPQWIANDAHEFAAVAARLAAHIPKLADLRANLRELMATSRLCDQEVMAEQFSASLRLMWAEAGLPQRLCE